MAFSQQVFLIMTLTPRKQPSCLVFEQTRALNSVEAPVSVCLSLLQVASVMDKEMNRVKN